MWSTNCNKQKYPVWQNVPFPFLTLYAASTYRILTTNKRLEKIWQKKRERVHAQRGFTVFVIARNADF